MPDTRPAIIFAGDSLTEWFDWQRRFPAYRIQNMGIAGEPVEGLLSRAGLIIARSEQPDYLFLMTGINNIAMQDFSIMPRYRELVSRFKGAWPSTKVVVQSILPVILEWIEEWRIPEVNRLLMDLCREAEVTYLDIYRRFVDISGIPVEEYLLDDGVHLSPRGYEVWSGEVGRFLSSSENPAR